MKTMKGESGRLKAAAATLGALAVLLGALGAHAWKGPLEASGNLESWHTAVLYHLVHAVAAFSAATSAGRVPRGAIGLWIAGVVLFSGSIYCMALGGPKWLGPVTPLGGVSLIAGWIWAALGTRRQVGEQEE